MITGAIICICLSAWVFVAVFVANLNPASPKWASDSKIQMFWVPLLVCLVAFGVFFLFKALTSGTASLTMAEFSYSLVVVVLTLFLTWLIKPAKKIKLYSSQRGRHSKA